jgi:hypothetical protein
MDTDYDFDGAGEQSWVPSMLIGITNFYVPGKALERLAAESRGDDDRRLATVSSIPKPIILGQVA